MKRRAVLIGSASRLDPVPSHDVEVRLTEDRGRGVFARRIFQEGETVVSGAPISWVKVRTHHSLQMDVDKHALFDEPACLINHCCDPNTGVADNARGGYDFVALREIAADEEITFDYATTEYESIAVMECFCGAWNCRGRSGGFKVLPPDHPLIRRGRIAGYLKSQPTRRAKSA